MTRKTAPLLLVALLLVPTVAPAAVAAGSGVDHEARFATLKDHLAHGNVTDAQAIYDDTFRHEIREVNASLDARIDGAFATLASNETSELNATLAEQTVAKGILHGSYLVVRHKLDEREVEAAESWFGVLEGKFDGFSAISDAHVLLEEMEKNPDEIDEHKGEVLAKVRSVFLTKTLEEVEEVFTHWNETVERVEKAHEAELYYGPLRDDVALKLGQRNESALHHELEELVEYARVGNRDEARHEADEIRTALDRYAGAEAGDLATRAQDLIRSVELLVVEYDEYVDDGTVVDRSGYEDEVLGLFLPAVKDKWTALEPELRETAPDEADEIDAGIADLERQINATAPNQQVHGTADTIVHELKEATGAASAPATGFEAGVQALRSQLDAIVAAYKAGDKQRALDLTQQAYLEYYEPIEPQVKANAPQVNAEIERLLNQELKQEIQSGAPAGEVEATVAQINTQLDTASAAAAETASSGKAFFDSFVIIAREGFEAILIVGAVVAYLRATDNEDKNKYIWAGVVGALLATLFLYVAVQTVIDLSGANREIIEGATALLAVTVLFYVSYWMIDKVQIGKWNRFIREKVGGALETGSMWALTGVAFLAVFREGLETVLFYQALFTASPGLSGSIAGGFLVGIAVLAVVGVAFYKYGVKIPLRPFFAVTSALLFYLAFSFMGAGIHELQEAGTVTTSVVPGLASTFAANPGVAAAAELFGIYPTVETLLGQGLLLLAGGLVVVWSFHIEPMLAGRKAPD